MKLQILITGIAFLFLISCNKDERQAIDSVEGVWEVKAITSNYGNFNGNSFSSTTQETETGDLGIFNFSAETVAYNFTRNDTVYTNDVAWNLMTEKVNSGFTRVNQHTLTITNNFVFDLTFEDATSNSEKNATEMTFIKNARPDDAVLIEMKLEKQ